MTRPPFKWHLHWPTTLFVFAVLPCLLGFGFWQLHRADEKRLVQQQFDALRAAPPLSVTELDDNSAAYARVALSGIPDDAHSFLLDNRTFQGRVGYEVVTPIVLPGQERVLLVNRGWIAGDPARRNRPTPPPLPAPLELHGYVYRELGPRSTDSGPAETGWPRLVESLDIAALQGALGRAVFPFVVRLDADSPGALVAEWSVVSSSPERHTGYAVQWFAMAVVLALLWFWRSSNLRDWLRR